MAHINRVAARLRADPNWQAPTPEQAEKIKQHFKALWSAEIQSGVMQPPFPSRIRGVVRREPASL